LATTQSSRARGTGGLTPAAVAHWRNQSSVAASRAGALDFHPSRSRSPTMPGLGAVSRTRRPTIFFPNADVATPAQLRQRKKCPAFGKVRLVLEVQFTQSQRLHELETRIHE
jgi:hypothetical protein